MPKPVLLTLLGSLVVAASAFAQVTGAIPPRQQIVTMGEGEARVSPDRAWLSVGVQTRGATATAAAVENARRQRGIIDTLVQSGIQRKLIGTTGYTVYPETKYDKDTQEQRVTGYVVSNIVRSEIRRIDAIGALVDAVLAKGANQINSLQFFASAADDARRAALADAVSKARADAEAMARAAGGSIGDLLELSDVTSGPRPVQLADAAFSGMRVQAAPTPVEPGELTIRAVVTGRWQFVPGSK